MRIPAIAAVFVAIIASMSACSQENRSSAAPGTDTSSSDAILPGSPQETTGIEALILGSIPLDSYPVALQKGNLRAREVVISPGGRIAAHAHDSHPAIVYVVEGELVEHRSDRETSVVRRQGDTYFEGPGVTHWVENVSSQPVRAFSIDIQPVSQDQLVNSLRLSE